MMKNTNKKVLAMAAAAALVFGFNSMAADNNVQYDNDNHTTITLNGTKITGAGKGSITSTSTDLVTGGQLYSRFSDIDDSINNINLNIASNNETVSAIQNKLTETTTKANTALNSIKTTGFWYDVNGKRAFNMTSSNNEMNLVAGDNMNISSVTNTSGTVTGIKFGVKSTGKVEAGNTGIVTGDTVYQAIKDMPTDASFAGKASTALDNLTEAGEAKITTAATDAAKKAAASKAETDGSNIDVAKYSAKLGTTAVTENGTGLMTSGGVYTALSGLGDTYAKTDASNISVSSWQKALGTGKNEANDNGLITGDTLNKALSGFTGGKTYTAGTGINISDDNKISVKAEGSIASGNTGLVTGGQVADAISRATEGLATDTNIANKADKDLSNISDAGKQVIQDTMKDSLAQKADASKLTEVSGKVDTNTSDISSLKENKADKTYVDEGLAKKADISYVDQGLAKKADIDSVYTKQETDKKIAESTAAINANVSNKADKDLSNITDAGKQVIQDTMKDSLAKKADASKLTEVSGKVDSNTSAIASLKENKADKTYIDTGLAKKADKADVDTLSGKVSDNEKSINDLKDSKAEKDGSNIDVNSFSTKLNTGKVERGNNGLVSGGTVFSAVESIKETTGVGLVTVEDNTVKIAKDSEASRIDVSGANGSRVITGVATNARDMSSAANVGYVNGVADDIYHDMDAMNHNLTKDIKDAGAVGAALAGLHHLDYDPDNKLDVAVAAGTYRGTTAEALGLFYQPNENVMFSVGGTMGADHNAFNAGVSFKIGGGANGQTTSKAAMAAEIRTLKADNEKQAQEIKELKDQVALLMQKMELSSTVEKSIVK